MSKPARKQSPAARTTILYRATPYQVRAFARLRLEGMTVQGYLNAVIESDLQARTEVGWTPEYGGPKCKIEKPKPRPGILR